MKHPITGVYCAATTPIDQKGKVRLDLFAEHCKALIHEGAHGVAILGTTGEANNYSAKERMALVDAVQKAGITGEQLLPGTSACSVPETIELTSHAVSARAKACVLLPPYYYKGVSDKGLFRFYSDVIEGVNDPKLKVILYHIPQVTQIPLSHNLIEKLIQEFGDTIIGIKDSSGDIENMKAMVNRFDNFSVLAGADPLLKPLLEAGGAGSITATSNLRSDSLRVVFDHWSDPSVTAKVEAAQKRINQWRTLSNSYVQLPTIKTMVAKARDNMDWLNVRPPLVPLNEQQQAHIWEQMAQLDS
ncbi:dihydrodipicolinate synthase family protein [Marinomonas sp. RS-M-Aa-14]|uniref:dihydrodipicolinate synthase family protein n=1 Tax=Marinomonas sp. RS-M-Aa-14 TaxID=3241169 RepID=UPI003AAD82C3